ncbi:MAG: diguanylate cyclase [Acidobacteria bacterium]|nr:diguanylate cyclase [Acidobacteriota bacterium]
MRVLIAEDSRSYRMVLRQILENKNFEVIETTDGEEALRILEQDDPPDIAVLDWIMPGMTGPEVCRRVRGRGDATYTYLILLTGRDRIEDLAEGLDSGADDYLRKPFVRQELEARIQVGQRNVILHQALSEARRELWEQSVMDALTGVWNRRGIHERLESVASTGDPLSLIMVDIDFFKRVNDDYGHPAGDAVLQVVARRLSHVVRESDEVGRFGGEEFLVVLPGTGHREAIEIADRLRRIISSDSVRTEDGCIDVTASFGVATAEAGSSLATSDLISSSDRALYRAKENGRNRVESGDGVANVRYFPEVASGR